MLQLGSNAASNGTKNDSGEILETTAIGFFSRGAAEDVMSQYLERRYYLDKFMHAV